MTRTIFFALTLLISLSTIAQNSADFFRAIPPIDESTPEWARLMYSDNPSVVQVEKMYKEYFEKNEFVKTLHTQNHKHWLNIIQPMINEEGFIVQLTEEQEKVYFEELIENDEFEPPMNIPGTQNGWVPMGPFETFKQNTMQAISWHKNIYAIDQSLSNPNLLICGTEAGGVYKTTDKALNWQLISKGEVFSGSNAAVKIHPTDTNNFLLASNSRIYQSLDGGDNWIERHTTSGTGNEFQYAPSDDSLIYHTSSSGLFKSTNGGVTWSQIYTQSCWDIDFHPTDSAVAYLLKSNTTAVRCELFRSDDFGNSWTIKDSNWYEPTTLSAASINGGKIAVTDAAPDIVHVCLIGNSKANDNGWIGMYKSSNRGEIWTDPDNQDGGPYYTINGSSPWNVAAYSSGYHQGYYNFDMEASQSDSNLLWVASIRLSESTDGGQTFKSIGGANSTTLSDIHADVQDIEVNGNEIWVASDGGINYSDDTLNSHVAVNRGILAGHFWGFNTGWNEDTYTGGKYHDGTSGWSESYGLGNAYNIGGVEEASGYVHPIESRKLMYRTHYASNNTSVKTIPSTFGGAITNHPSLPKRPNESYLVAERSGVYFDPRYADHMFIGLGNIIYKSKNGGASFKEMYEFPDSTGIIYEIEISRSNPDIMYAVYNELGGYWNPCELWKTTNGGSTWAKTTTDPTGNNRRFRISIHPEDANEVWLCTPRGTNGNKVFSTVNGGGTWVNRTTSTLDGENVTDILYQGGSDDIVYLTSQNGVFIWNTSNSTWDDYSTSLPLIAKSLQINPFYKDGELRLASTGRGIWARDMKDTLFSPIAQPITYTDSVYCTRDTTQFDCYSMLQHNGASWDWTITPSPIFISDSTIRNPRVLFGDTGNYTVSLKVTNAQGDTNSKTIENMVYVSNGCDADTVPGLAMSCLTNTSYTNIPNLGINQVDSFTMSAWIKPNTIQNSYAGIVMNDGSSAGINFRANNELAYHWPGGSWWWSSGLFVDTNQWSHVAIAVTPTSVTLYLNGESSTHTTSPQLVDIQTMKIGNYQGWTSRNFNGDIDEVCLWNRSLSQNEIRELRHLTRTGPVAYDEDLLVYYQFNTIGSTSVMDRIGLRHATLAGDAEKVISTAPVGGGVSDRVTANTSGTFNWSSSNTQIDFGSTSANGEIVVFRLNILPDSLPNSNPNTGHYWIINNYGSNSTFSSLDHLRLKTASGQPFGNPSDAKLWTRSDNEHLENWTSSCGADNFDNGFYDYSNSCSINNMSQFFTQSVDSFPILGEYLVSQVNAQICSYDSIYLEGQFQHNAGVYYDTVNISSAVDSVYITTVSLDSITGIDIQNACDSYTWIDGNTYTQNNNSATFHTNVGEQCDSVSTLNLSLSYSSSYTDNVTSCDPINWLDGNLYSSSNNMATHIVTNAAGCDSIITLNLVLNSIDSSVVQNGSTLMALQSGAIYQWLDCEDNLGQIVGATAQTFAAQINGSYAVLISLGDCADTSDCMDIKNVGFKEPLNNNTILIYPNPNNGFFQIQSDQKIQSIRVINNLGQTVYTNQYNSYSSNSAELSVSLAAGLYVVEIETPQKTELGMLILNN
jgi:photosystem II stability/assembly factor-like uncharacterized protein